MKKTILIFCLLILAAPVISSEVVPMPELQNPNTIMVDDDRLYIADGISVYIYSLKDFSRLRKFGREGEGAQEFKEKIYTFGVYGNYITINSVGKLSFFTRAGEFVKARKTPPQHNRFKPLGEKFTGAGILVDKNTIYNTINIYDADFNKEKEIARVELEVQPGKGTKVFHGTLSVDVNNNRIFSAGTKYLVIHIYDEKGEKLRTISREYNRRKVTEEDKNRLINHLQTNQDTREYYEMLKPVKFAAYYPALKEIIAADNKIYALTWKRVNNETECFIFSFNGDLLKTTFLPIKNKDAVDFSPLTIKKSKLYQLAANENNKKWALHIADIK